MKRLLLTICLTVMMMFVAAPGVQAAAITGLTYDITSDHMDGAGGAGTPPFGTVNLVQDGANVNFTVTLFDGSKFVNTGAGAGQNFLFDATGVVATDITGMGVFSGALTATAFSPAVHADGTGDWTFGVVKTGQATGGGAAYPGPLTFTVANALISEVNIGNGSNIFAIDILSGQTGNTGLVDVSTPPRVPEASAMLLLGTGLVGLVAWRRKKRLE